MSALRKAEQAESRAYAAYVAACADVVTELHENGDTSPEYSRLARRAGAYRAQWDAAWRRIDELAARADRFELAR